MGLFDIFKKKSGQQTVEKFTLEELLQKAADEPDFRADFYIRLLTDDVFVITPKDSSLSRGEQMPQSHTKVKIVSFPDGTIPVFTTPQRIFDKGVNKEQVEYLKMKGVNLFELAKGATFLLNPYSDNGMKLLPDDVEKMLGGKIPVDTARIITFEKKTKVQIGQPTKYPTNIIKSLKDLFAKNPNINAAYLGWICYIDDKEPPHFIFGIDSTDDLQSLTQEAGFIAKQFLAEDDIVDFVKVDNGSDVSSYLKSTTPFYKK